MGLRRTADALNLDDLVQAVEIAQLAGVGPPAVTNWINRHADFPKPVIQKNRTSFWDVNQVIAWLESKYPGRYGPGAGEANPYAGRPQQLRLREPKQPQIPRPDWESF